MPWNDSLEDAARAGDVAAIAELAATALPQMIAAARRLMGNRLRTRDSSTDIAISAYGEALQHLSGLDYRSRTELRNWLVTHVEHKVRNKARYHSANRRDLRREEGPASLSDLPSEADPIDAEALRDEIERVQFAMEQIGDDDRRLLALNFTAGLSLNEVADLLGISHGAARARKVRALARLKPHLEEKDGDAS